LRGLIARAIVNHKDVIESFAGSPNDVADMFLVIKRRNHRGSLRTYIHFCHVEQVAWGWIIAVRVERDLRARWLCRPTLAPSADSPSSSEKPIHLHRRTTG
jgi:hypothetical protein